MKLIRIITLLSALTTITITAHAGNEYGSAKEAEAMVQKAVAHIKTAGSATAYTDFTDKKEGWVDRDIYVVVYGLDGTVLAHGQNPKQVGKNLLEFKDADGKAFVQERVELAKSKGKFWQDYKFTDPVTKKILPKSAYCEKLDDTAVCAGIYKR
jgi:cytochrome c